MKAILELEIIHNTPSYSLIYGWTLLTSGAALKVALENFVLDGDLLHGTDIKTKEVRTYKVF